MVDLPTDSTQRFSCEKGLVVDSSDVLYIFHGLGHHEQRKTWLLEKPSYPHIFFVEDYLVTGRRRWRRAKLFCFDTKTFNFLRTIIFVSPFFYITTMHVFTRKWVGLAIIIERTLQIQILPPWSTGTLFKSKAFS